MNTGACEKTLLSGGPLPCNPEAEAALQPMIWHSEGLAFQGYYFPEDILFSQTPVSQLSVEDARGSGVLLRLHTCMALTKNRCAQSPY